MVWGRAEPPGPVLPVVDPEHRRGASNLTADAPSKLNSVCDLVIPRPPVHIPRSNRERYWAAARATRSSSQ